MEILMLIFQVEWSSWAVFWMSLRIFQANIKGANFWFFTFMRDGIDHKNLELFYQNVEISWKNDKFLLHTSNLWLKWSLQHLDFMKDDEI